MKRILIIDDDASIRAALAKVLRTEGYQVVLAADSDEAVSQFGVGGIDLILLDLNLPIRSGWDLFEWFTRTDPFVPIIIITGRADQCVLAEGAGVGALIEKPINVEFLLKCIRDLLAENNEARLSRLLGNSHELRYAPARRTPRARSRISTNKPRAYETET